MRGGKSKIPIVHLVNFLNRFRKTRNLNFKTLGFHVIAVLQNTRFWFAGKNRFVGFTRKYFLYSNRSHLSYDLFVLRTSVGYVTTERVISIVFCAYSFIVDDSSALFSVTSHIRSFFFAFRTGTV